MNKYDFDFIRIEDVLYNLLGITETNNINALKMQIRENLLALQEALMKKNNGVSDSNVRAVEKQLAMIDAENDIDKVLSECIKVRLYAVLSLDAKIRLNDSYGAKSEKKAIRNELYAISDLVKSVPSFNKFLKNREILLNYIDSKNRIVSYNKRIDTSNINSEIPQMKLEIKFDKNYKTFPIEYEKVLKEAEISCFKFGELIYSTLPDDQGNYTQEIARKSFVGIIKKNEFGEFKKYNILMDDISTMIPPEFYRDIVFSDMLLRHASKNLNFVGNFVKIPEDQYYGYKVEFDSDELKDLLSAIYFEKNKNLVKTQSNVFRVKSVNDAYYFMQQKMDMELRELVES